jgi:hypothetical protein
MKSNTAYTGVKKKHLPHTNTHAARHEITVMEIPKYKVILKLYAQHLQVVLKLSRQFQTSMSK